MLAPHTGCRRNEHRCVACRSCACDGYRAVEDYVSIPSCRTRAQWGSARRKGHVSRTLAHAEATGRGKSAFLGFIGRRGVLPFCMGAIALVRSERTTSYTYSISRADRRCSIGDCSSISCIAHRGFCPVSSASIVRGGTWTGAKYPCLSPTRYACVCV